MTFSTFKIPMKVKCIEAVSSLVSTQYPNLDFGTVGKIYMVSAIVPNGCYYVLRGEHLGPLMGEVGEVNHLVNMWRFAPVQWMTEKGVVDV